MKLRETMLQVAQRLELHAEQASAFGATLKLVVTGAESGVWQLRLREQPALVEGDGPADCTLRVDGEDLLALVAQRASPAALFFSGKLKAEGDVSLALRAAPFLSLLAQS